MSKYDDAAEAAAKQTDRELIGKLSEITSFPKDKLDGLVPDEDRQYAEELIAVVNGHSDNNKVSNAWFNFAAKASDVAIKAVRKIVLGF